MSRCCVENGGWFDDSKAVKYSESTWWNGSNHISCATGSQWDHEDLYYTESGNWTLNSYSQIQGSRDTYNKISINEAINWLIKNGYTTVEELPDSVRKLVEDKINEQEL